MIESASTMQKTITFVSLFRNTDPQTKVTSWGASFHVGDVDVGASHLPKFDVSLFTKKVSPTGVAYLVSKTPLLVEHSDVRPGKKAGRFFANIASISAQPEMNGDELDALLDETTDAKPEDKGEAQAEAAAF